MVRKTKKRKSEEGASLNKGAKQEDKQVNMEKEAADTAEKLTDREKTDKDQEARTDEKSAGIEARYDELNDKYLRLYSEFDNYRKRTIREKVELSKTAAEKLVTELLPVLDDFKRAIRSSEESDDCESVKEGVRLIYTKFFNVLEKEGLKAIEAVGEEFNTDYHDAVTQIPAPEDEMKGKVIDEIEKGYMLNDKVIRFAKVVIGQ